MTTIIYDHGVRLPPPCGEGLGVGVHPSARHLKIEEQRDHHPHPSPQGGGEAASTVVLP